MRDFLTECIKNRMSIECTYSETFNWWTCILTRGTARYLFIVREDEMSQMDITLNEVLLNKLDYFIKHETELKEYY